MWCKLFKQHKAQTTYSSRLILQTLIDPNWEEGLVEEWEGGVRYLTIV